MIQRRAALIFLTVKASPAAAEGSLFIRTEDALYRIGQPLGE